MRFLRGLFLRLRGLVNLRLSTFRVCFVWHSFYQLPFTLGFHRMYDFPECQCDPGIIKPDVSNILHGHGCVSYISAAKVAWHVAFVAKNIP